MYLVAGSFAGYFVLLAYSDLTRPEPHGFVAQFRESGLVLSAVTAGSPAALAGLITNDHILRVDGRSIRHRLDWQLAETNLRSGQAVEVEIEREGVLQTVTFSLDRMPWRDRLTTVEATLAGIRSVQLVTLVLAVAVALRRPFDLSARVGAWLLATVGVYSVVLPFGFAANWRALPVVVGLVLWLPFLSSLAIGAVLFTFFAVFPRPIARSRWPWFLAWVPVAAVLPFQLQFGLAAVYRPQQSTELIDWTMATVILSAAYVAAALAVLVVGYGRLSDITERRRVRVLVVGLVVASASFLPIVGGYWRAGASFGGTTFGSPVAAVGTILGLAFPASFTYAILRHRLFDARMIVRSGLQYALARSVLISIVPVIIGAFALDLWIHRGAPVVDVLRARGWAYGALGGFAVVARFRRTHWLDELDRRFFRERYNSQRVLRSVIEEVRRAENISDAAPHIAAQIEAAFHPEVVARFARDPDDGRFLVATQVPASVKLTSLQPDSKLVSLLQWLRRPAQVSGVEQSGFLRQLPLADVEWLRSSSAELLLPVLIGNDIDSFFMLGPKRSQEPYTAEDEDLLMAVAESLGFASTRAPTASRPGSAFQDCPECGTCYDWGTERCPQDGAVLSATTVPRLLVDRYRLDRRVGQGGMGTVYAAFDTALSRDVAAKLIREELVGGPGAAERFQSEARLAAALSHPNVVTVHDIGVTPGGRPFFIMELLKGCTLRDELERTRRLPAARVRHLLRGVCLAIESAHQREMIHRDVKPENVFLCLGDVPKILDFGLAKALETGLSATLTDPGHIIGTLPYMAPERLRGEAVSPDWDLWALAVMGVEMLTGTRPFGDRPEVSPRLSDLPPDLTPFFRRALSPNPLERPTSALEFVDELDALLGEHT